MCVHIRRWWDGMEKQFIVYAWSPKRSNEWPRIKPLIDVSDLYALLE